MIALRDILWPPAEWLLAVAAGLLPKRAWRHVEPPLPVARTAWASALATFFAGVTLGADGFLDYAGATANETNAWMLRNLTASCATADCSGDQYRLALVPYGVSSVTLFAFLFFTPLGLLSTYLTVSGSIRLISAYVGDPRGDFLLSAVYAAATGLARGGRRRRARVALEREAGPVVPDVLASGSWAGLPADYLVIASRPKAGWDPGAIILTSDEWYRLGASFETRIDGRLRTAYPLTRMETAEVVRRGIRYELPRLSPRYRAPGGTP